MNVKLMLRVADYIEAHPEEYDQREWCGTECCIAGRALAIQYKVKSDADSLHAVIPDMSWVCFSARARTDRTIAFMASQVLELSDAVAGDLFCAGMDWPQPFTLDYLVDTPQERARKAVAYLRHLVTVEMVSGIIHHDDEEPKSPFDAPVVEHVDELVLA